MQQGESLGLPHSRPLPTIGIRCHELRINDEAGAFRILYRVDDDAIVILNVFLKKTRETPRSIIADCKRRIRQYDTLEQDRGKAMRKSKRARLEREGWVVGSVKEFLGLSEADAVLIEIKVALSRSLRERRKQYGLSQVELARRLQSSQSRVAKMEAGDPSVSMDLLVNSLLLLGASSSELAKVIRGGERRKVRHAAA